MPKLNQAGRLPARGRPLSARELDVLALAAQGLTNVEIGRRLFIEADTAKTHLARLMSKLGARNRAHAVALAYQTRLFTPARLKVKPRSGAGHHPKEDT